MEFLYLLQKIHNPVLDTFMEMITQLGEETAFLVVALIVFWCVDKYKGYYVLSIGFIGTLANQFMKLCFRIPRPWVLDESFIIDEKVKEAAAGYSFPSGHTQNAVGTFGAIAFTGRNKWLRIGAVAIAVLVPFSRMYLCVHTPLDVFVAAAMACLLIVIMKPLLIDRTQKTMPYILGIMTLLSVAFLLYVHMLDPAKLDSHNLQSGHKNAFTLFGCLCGLIVVYIVDELWLKFPTKAVWWAQLIKVLVGLGLVLAVKSGLKAPIEFLFGPSWGRAIRYFLIVIVAGVLWPLSFRLITKFGNKE